MQFENVLVLFIVSCVAFVVYLFPAAVASQRRHRNRTAILAMNVLLGCSGLFWIVALIWALTSDVERE